ncbi:MAG: glutamine synthetase, partial [Verrucomicrobiaceae bacterium]
MKDLDALLTQIESGTVDTIQIGAPDMYARLVGKRYTSEYFEEQLTRGTTHGCSYLFAVNMEMDPQDGYHLANWDTGFGDFEMRPDFTSIFPIPWETASALVFSDFHHHDGALVEQAPRTILKRQIEKLASHGWRANLASELEFYLYQDSYEAAAQKDWQHLEPSSQYRIDYHLLQPGRDEPIFREMRNQMLAAGIPVESSKGEWGRGQHEVNI